MIYLLGVGNPPLDDQNLQKFCRICHQILNKRLGRVRQGASLSDPANFRGRDLSSLLARLLALSCLPMQNGKNHAERYSFSFSHGRNASFCGLAKSDFTPKGSAAAGITDLAARMFYPEKYAPAVAIDAEPCQTGDLRPFSGWFCRMGINVAGAEAVDILRLWTIHETIIKLLPFLPDFRLMQTLLARVRFLDAEKAIIDDCKQRFFFRNLLFAGHIICLGSRKPLAAVRKVFYSRSQVIALLQARFKIARQPCFLI